MEAQESKDNKPQRQHDVQVTVLQNTLPPDMDRKYKLFKKALVRGRPEETQNFLQKDGDFLLEYAIKFNMIGDIKTLFALAETIPGYRFIIEYRLLAHDHPNTTLLLLEQLEKQNGDVNPHFKGYTLLHHAARKGYLEVVQKVVELLFKRGKRNFESLKYQGRSPLLVAIEHNRSTVAVFLMQYVENINPALDDGGATGMHFAAENNSIQTLDILIKMFQAQKRKIDIRTSEGISLLHTAAAAGQKETYKIVKQALIETGEEIYPTDKTGATPLHAAVRNNQASMVNYLSNELIKAKKTIHQENKENETPLHLAARYGRVEATAVLIERLLAAKETISPMTTGVSPFQMAFSMLKVLIVKDKQNKQISSAKIANYFSVLELFMQQPSFEETLLLLPGENSLCECVAYKRETAIKCLLPRLISEWQNCVAQDTINAPLWYDVSLGIVFQNNSVTLASILQELPFFQGEKINFFKTECIQVTLLQAAIANHPDLIQPILAFLKKHETVETILQWLKNLENDARENNDKILQKFLSCIHKSVTQQQKELNSFVKEKVKAMKTMLAPYQSIAMLEHQDLFSEMERCYETLRLSIEKAITSLESLNDIVEVKQSALNHERELSPLLKKYQAAKQACLLEENRLKLAQEEQLEAVLQDWENKISILIKDPRVQQTKDAFALLHVPSSFKKSLREQYQIFENAIEALKSKVEESRQAGILSDLIAESFESLSVQTAALEKEVNVFSDKLAQHKQDRMAAEAEKNLAQMRKQVDEALSLLEKQISTIGTFLKNSKKHSQTMVVYGFLEGLAEADLTKFELALNNAKQIKMTAADLDVENGQSLHLQLCNANDQLKNMLREIPPIESRMAQEKKKIEQSFSEEAKISFLKKEILCEVSKIRNALGPVLSQSILYDQMAEDKKNVSDEIIKTWRSYKKVTGILDELEEKLKEDLKVSVLEKQLETMQFWRPDLQNKSNILATALGQYHLMAANDPRLTPVPAVNPQPLLFMRQKKPQGPVVLYGLSLSCVNERTQLNMMIDLISRVENQEIAISIKINALLWSMAALFEKMKQVYDNPAQAQAHHNDETLLLKKSTQMRNSIFHHVLKRQITEENFLRLCQLARFLTCDNIDQTAFDVTLRELSSILSLEDPDPETVLAQIELNREYLRKHAQDVQQEGPSVGNHLLLQTDCAFRMGQSDALLGDLMKKSKDTPLNAIVRSKMRQISEELHMNVGAFNCFATGIRHEGLEEGVCKAVEGLMFALTQAFSKLQLAQASEAERPAKKEQRRRRR